MNPKKVSENHQMKQFALIGCTCLHLIRKCTESLFTVVIMNVEVETNVRTNILSQLVDWYPFEPKKGIRKPSNEAVCPYWVHICLHLIDKCTESLFKIVIMNIEVETNVKTKISSHLVDWYPFEPKKGIRKPSNVAVCQYQGYVCLHLIGRCIESLFKVMIINVEVEMNVKTKILS